MAGRNAVLEALRVGVPATALLMVTNLEPDDRLREAVGLANTRGIPLQEVTRPELDQTCGVGAVHQGLAVRVPPYAYHHPEDLLDRARATGATPLFVALDGITDPRNLGAIVRSAAAFGAHGVIVPQRRAAGMTAAAWKTSAGAAARLPVALAANLTQTLTRLRERGLFVVGLDVDGTESLPGLALADRPLVLVVGSEGRGMSRLVAQTCDAMVSIPISATTESLNAGIAASVALYEVSQRRARTR